jgi:hypothetical protein
MRIQLTTLLAIVTATQLAHAETRQVWDSPAASVAQSVGITDIEVKYHRPGVKGREIWGKLVPYGEEWRAGANEATTISFSTPVKVAGKPVPAGTYALFVVPTRDKWTLILSKDPEQWGAYFHKPEHDLMRFDVTPASAAPREWLAYELDLQGRSTVVASLAWEKLKASFPIEVDVDGLYQAYLAGEVTKADASSDAKARSVTYLTAAKYWVARGEKLDEAAKLLDKGDKIGPTPWGYEWRARLLAKQNHVSEALPLLDKAKAAAKGKFPEAYLTGLDTLRAEWTAKKK